MNALRLAGLCALVGLACGRTNAVQSLTATPGELTLSTGEPATVTVTATFVDGQKSDVTGSAEFSSDDPQIASLNKVLGGTIITGAGPGSTTVTVSLDGVSTKISVTVTSGTLTRIDVTPASLTLPVDATRQLTATGTFSDGSMRPLSGVTWSSSDTSVADVDATGLVHAHAHGAATLTAALSGQSGTAALTVSDLTLQRLDVTPGAGTLPVGGTLSFTATGTWSDGSMSDLTTSATWSSSDASIVLVQDNSAKGVASGAADIIAAVGAVTGRAHLTVAAATLTAIDLSPSAPTLAAGTVQQMTATGLFSDGSMADITAMVTWSSDGPPVSVSAQGLVSAVAAGTANVTASMSGVQGSTPVTVTAATLTSLEITPPTATLAIGTQVQLQALGHFSDGSVQDVSAAALWSAMPPGVVTVAGGKVTATAAGSAQIQASLLGQSATASVTVSAATLKTIEIGPPVPSLPVGQSIPLTAVGTYSDGSMQVLTTQVSWTSSSPAVASVSTGGVLKALTAGSTKITATLGAVSGSTNVTVTAATLTGVTVNPASASLAAGASLQLTATATWSDGSSTNVTAMATWSSDQPARVTVGNGPGAQGLAKGISAGAANVTATLQGLKGTSALTVTAATLTKLSITPAMTSAPAGSRTQFTARADYSDGTSQDVTAQVLWTSSAPAVATVSNAAGSRGVATAIAAGTTTLTATLGMTAATATLTVVSPTLISITVTPAGATASQGGVVQLKATGGYSDGSMADLTTVVSWTSSAPNVATVSNAPGSQGIARALAVGTATLTATSGAVTGSTLLTVTGTTLQSLTVTPATATLAKGTSQPFIATAIWSDGSMTDVSASVTWTSSNVSVAVMNGASAFGVAAGSSTIKAALNGKSATASLTVTGLTVVKVDVLPSTLTLAPMASSALKAQATFSDGSTQDVTSSAAWASANGAVASVSGQGVVFAVMGGQTDVRATFQGQTGTCHVTVPSVTLTGLTVSPASPVLFVGAQQQLTAMGTYSDGSMQDLTQQCSWSSQPTAVAIVTAFGRVTAVSAGMAQVTARFGALSASASVTVNPTSINSIEVSPAAPTLVKGSTVQLTATAVMSDGSTLDVTSSVMWSSNRPAVGAVTGSGLVTAVSPGAATVTATMGGISGSAIITVSMVPLSSIEVAPTALTLAVGQSQQYSATGVFADGSTQDLTALCTWKSTLPNVAAISGTGHAVAAAAGMTTLSCAYGGLTGSGSLTVTAATIVSISLTPDSPSLAKGTALSLHATGMFSDGSVQDVTQDCAWSSDKTSVASVSSSGLVTGVSVGTAQLSCTALGKSGSTPVTVGAPTLVSLEVSPAFATVAAGTSTALVATGVFSDDTTQDLTTQVTWTSSKPGVATVSNAAGSHGLARGVSAGTATVTATFGAISGTATVNVTNAMLTFIDVEPFSPFIEVNGKQQLTATAFYSDNSSQDITASASWSSDTTSVARVSNAPGSRGLTTGVAIGSATITCTFQGQQGQAFVQVNDGKLISIAVFPTAPNAAKGTKVQFQAIGVYDDGNAVDITAQVAWSSSDTTVATVSAAGLSRALGVGQAEITATLQGIGGSTVLTVGAATLSSIAITPLNPAVAQGGVQPLTATGTYSDGTTQDLTTQVIWSSSNTVVARVSNAAGSPGYATGLTLGTSTVKARLGTVSGTTTLTVTNVTLQFLDVEPFGSLAPGTTLQLTVTGFYSDGSQADLTSQVSCSVDAPTVATVGPTNLVTAVMAGTVNVTCTFGGQMGQTQLTVQNAAAIAVTPTNGSLKRGTTQQYTASAIFVDGSTQDVTAFATWSSNTPTVATVSSTAGSKGLVTGVAPGTASIKALLSGVGGSTTVTVTP